jgi:O-succinylbenzoic acid--CoA ligase
VPDLVALDLPGGPGFVAALRSVWDAGDAALPVDQRLPGPARRRLFERLGPHAVIGPDGGRTATGTGIGGEPMATGDALVVATSGTTGDPRGVVLTHAAVEAHARGVHEVLAVDPATDRWLACLPLAHVGGLGVVTRALVTGTPLDVLPGFDLAAVRAAADGGATLVSLVPTALDRVGASRFRWVVLGGSADPVERPANVVRTYGLTETGGGVVYQPGGPLPGTEVRVVGGEIELRGPMLLRAYRSGDDPKSADGWLATGDLGELDAGGRLRVFGRRGDLIVTGGENVWPEAVESVLRTHPAVAEVAVAGRPDPEWGARIVAYVVPAEAVDPPHLDDLRGHVKETLPAFAAPRELVLVPSLPRTALGKVRRSALG